MTDIVGFLTARLGEDEADARAAIADRSDTERWEAHGWRERNRFEWIVRDAEEKYASHGYPGYTPVAAAMPGGPRDGQGVAAHIARHDPARVLREVAAKRRVVARHHAEGRQRQACEGCAFGNDGEWLVDDIEECPELRDLVAVYADHPNYDVAWGTE